PHLSTFPHTPPRRAPGSSPISWALTRRAARIAASPGVATTPAGVTPDEGPLPPRQRPPRRHPRPRRSAPRHRRPQPHVTRRALHGAGRLAAERLGAILRRFLFLQSLLRTCRRGASRRRAPALPCRPTAAPGRGRRRCDRSPTPACARATHTPPRDRA